MEWPGFILRKWPYVIWSKPAFLGFINVDSKLLLLQNHLLLIFQIYIYNSRKYESLILKSLIREITKVKKHRGKNFNKQWKKHDMYKREWQQVENVWKTKTSWHFIWFSLWLKGGRGRSRSGQIKLVFNNQRDRHIGGRSFFSFSPFCNL